MRMLLVRRARIECFIVFDYRDRYPEATAQLARWVEEGKIAYAADVVDGLEQAPKLINRLFDGSNAGLKALDHQAGDVVVLRRPVGEHIQGGEHGHRQGLGGKAPAFP